MILDTSFLIALEREIRRGEIGTSGRAGAFLAKAGVQQFCITPVIAGELACGISLSERIAWESMILPFTMLLPEADTAWHYGTTYRTLSEKGELIGNNDLWIAAAALAHGLPVVTANENDFRRVPGLKTIGF